MTWKFIALTFLFVIPATAFLVQSFFTALKGEPLDLMFLGLNIIISWVICLLYLIWVKAFK